MPTLTEAASSAWEAPAGVSRENVIAMSNAVLARASAPVDEREDVFRLSALDMDWDIGVRVYEPLPAAGITQGADGKKVGIFLLHGGAGDFKSMDRFARLFAEKFSFKVVTMTFPGRLYLDDPSRDWPGDTIHPDGTARTPIWLAGEYVTPDQYEVVKDTSKRMKYGTRTSARAKPGTRFHDRMASWPVAFEEGMKEACRRHFPVGEFSIYAHGHSTGGPYVSMLSQRVANVAGLIAIENSSFGYINERKHIWGGHVGKIEGFERIARTGESWKDPFNDLYIRTWRDLARYRGSEALGQEGPGALIDAPAMADGGDPGRLGRRQAASAVQGRIHDHPYIVGALQQAARVSAQRLGMNEKETAALVDHYLGYTRELKGDGVKPVPPFLFVISKDSRDHSPEVYREVIIPMFQAMSPAPRVAVTRFGAGVHTYAKPEPDLPIGIAPAAAQFYHDAITGGFFVTG